MTRATPFVAPTPLLSTGISGLDFVLKGGLLSNRLYLIEGTPGAGKTTLALQFLREGAAQGESVLFVTLSETAEELHAVAATHGWSLEGIRVHEVIPTEDLLDPAQQQTIFHPTEIELSDTTQDILSIVAAIKPKRVVIDSLSELRLLADSPLRHRRQVLAFKQFFSKHNCTALMLDDRPDDDDMQLRSSAHGVINLNQETRDYGTCRRRLQVIKYRGMDFRSGYHDYVIVPGGVRVFPRLVAHESRHLAARKQISSDIPELDALLNGGLEEGTSTLIIGPSGTGKSTLSAQFALAAVNRNERAALFIFEESANLLLNRAEGVNIRLRQPMEEGRLILQQVDPAEMSPGEFAYQVCQAVLEQGAKVVVIDSLNGYLGAMPDERFLLLHLHELLTYLGQCGVITILVGVLQGAIGTDLTNRIDASYLADNIILLRHFEFTGEVRQAISIFKKRGSAHQRTIRAFTITNQGIHIGPPLQHFHGVLTGIPTYEGSILDEPESHTGG